jgi:hypothetical protein
MTRDLKLESWIRQKMMEAQFPGVHNYGWSWIGGCVGAYLLELEHPELKEKDFIGNVLPGTMGHKFMQEHALPEGSENENILILGHEEKRFIPMIHKLFRMSSVDTLVLDKQMQGLGVLDYKFIKDLTWVEQDAKDENKEQVNMYAYTSGALWYAIIYVEKLNYFNMRIHKYPTDPELAQRSIEKMKIVDRWVAGDRKDILWTTVATGLTHYSNGKKPYRFTCEPSSSGAFGGCLFKEFCLKELSKQFGQEFTSLFRYDEYLKQQEKVVAQ